MEWVTIVEAADTAGNTREVTRTLLGLETARAAFDEPGDFSDHNLTRRTLSAERLREWAEVWPREQKDGFGDHLLF